MLDKLLSDSQKSYILNGISSSGNALANYANSSKGAWLKNGVNYLDNFFSRSSDNFNNAVDNLISATDELGNDLGIVEDDSNTDQDLPSDLPYSVEPVTLAPPSYIDAPLATAYGMDASTAYQEALANTAYQRKVKDLQAAGLNPVLGYSGSGAASFYGTELSQGGVSYGGSGSSGSASDLDRIKNNLINNSSYIARDLLRFGLEVYKLYQATPNPYSGMSKGSVKLSRYASKFK